jgi:DNA-binding NarL/FixJ family response regulator
VPVRILIADDNSLVRTALRSVLESEGPWEIVEAANGEQALVLASRQTFHLIILDLAMPVVDGLRVAQAMIDVNPKVPIILHTLHASRRVATEASRVGVRRVVLKSERSAIVAAVREILGPPVADPALLGPVSAASVQPVGTFPLRPAEVEVGNEATADIPADRPLPDGSAPKS